MTAQAGSGQARADEADANWAKEHGAAAGQADADRGDANRSATNQTEIAQTAVGQAVISQTGTCRLTRAPHPSFRLIPSRFPPIGLFDTVATAADMAAAMELAGWTNDRLVAERVARLPREDWVHGRPNASIVMAAFLHVPPGGNRFNGQDLGAWYAAAAFPTAAAEVAHHLRREAVATGQPIMCRQYRTYQARLDGQFRDIRGERALRPEAYDPLSYLGSQIFGEAIRSGGGAGIVWDSLRHAGGICAVSYRPRTVLDIVQTDHVEITVTARLPRIEVRRLAAQPPTH